MGLFRIWELSLLFEIWHYSIQANMKMCPALISGWQHISMGILAHLAIYKFNYIAHYKRNNKYTATITSESEIIWKFVTSNIQKKNQHNLSLFFSGRHRQDDINFPASARIDRTRFCKEIWTGLETSCFVLNSPARNKYYIQRVPANSCCW